MTEGNYIGTLCFRITGWPATSPTQIMPGGEGAPTGLRGQRALPVGGAVCIVLRTHIISPKLPWFPLFHPGPWRSLR